MKRKILAAAITAALTTSVLSILPANAADPASREVNALQYTYEIIPLLAPFNEYFFVKTDNPHPESFRFSDKDSIYSETAVIYNLDSIYADVAYENEEIWRVNGGYLFKSFTTNGGEVTLQVHESITEQEFNTAVYGTPDPKYTGYSPYAGMPVGSYDKHYEDSASYSIVGYYKWVDTDIKLTLPPLVDDCDYLIQKYAGNSDFFSNMDSVQKGFSSICLYSGSYVRGDLYRSSDRDWCLSPAGHIDQSFYIYSPYSRKDNKSLLASALYPFRYDSLGFPGMMGTVSERLSTDSNYQWSSSNHAFIDVTYQGQTKTYGGQGNGEGQGISADKITHMFSFDETETSLTLEEAKKMLDAYASIEMDDDIPREDALTWKNIYDIVEDGAWVDMGGKYTYLYQKDDKDSFNADEWGIGNSIYWGGSLGYCSDMWVDGRYINKAECFVPGETFADHPESSILLKEAVVPELISYTKKWNAESGTHIYDSAEIVEETRQNVVYRYDSARQLWRAETSYGDFGTLETLIENGIVDSKYYDMLVLTKEEAETLIANGNTSRTPKKGYLFDGTVPSGTPFFKGDANNDGELGVLDIVMLQKWLLNTGDLTNWRNVDLCEDNHINVFDLILLKRRLLESN